MYLGYSDQSSGYYSTLEGAILALSPAGEDEVITILEDFESIEEQLRGARRRQKVEVAEDVRMAGHNEIIALWKEGNRLANRLAAMLGVEVASYPFTSGATAGYANRG